MDKKHQESKKFFEDFLKLCEEQDLILEQIDKKLRQMKDIAEFVLTNERDYFKNDGLNCQLQELKNEVLLLEKRLNSIIYYN